MAGDSKGFGSEGDELLGDALRIYLEHRRSGAGESDADLIRRHPKLRELLEPLLAQDVSIVGQLRAGVEIGEYRLVECIGRGGMGEVWEAEQLSLRRRVALKILRAQSFASAHNIERFRREALAGARLKHPCIVAVHAVGDAGGIHYIAQELVESRRTLATVLRECRERTSVPSQYWRETAEMFVRIAEALELAHGAGVIHRDLKPSNILIAADGTPKVADFGLALVAGEGELSRTGDMSGSPFYMSPEQASGARSEIEARSDVFSLGATLYEALTLQRPFDGDTLGQVLAKILLVDPRDPREIRSLCPPDLAVICMKMLEKAPQRRYGGMREVADELGRFLRSESILAKPAGAAGRAIKWSRRHPVIAASSAIVCVSLIVVSGLLLETARARKAAEISATKAGNSALAERAAAEQARVESRTSTRITDFLVEAFLEASPTRTLGQETTARDVLDEGVRNIREGLTEPTEQGPRARLLGTFGMVYSRLGLRAQAEELLLEARALGEAAFGPLDTRTLDNKSELARLYAETGRLQLSLELAGEIYEARAAKDGPESRVALRDEANFAQLLMHMNRLEEAEGHLQHALQGLEKLGEDTTVTLYGLAQVQRYLGRTEAARATLQQCIDLSDARKGLDAPDSLSVRETLAEFLLISGDTEGAARLFRQVAASRACVQGALHPETLQSLARAVGAESSSDPDAALGELHRLWTLCTSQFGAEDSTTLEVSNSLCTLLIEQRRDLEAEEQLAAMIDCEARRSLASPTKHFGELCSLATIELRLARPELALSIYEEVIHAADGGRHPNPESLNTALFQVIDLCHELRCEERALPSARRWLEVAALDHPQRESVLATVKRLESAEKER